MSVKFRGQEVRTPALRVLTAFLLGVWAGFFFVILLGLSPLLVPLLVTLHYLLVAAGRRGFVRWEGGKFSIQVDGDGFRRAT
jgi:hypothetical protein